MATNVEISKNGNENNLGVLRRFTKRVQGSGVLPRIRGRRYSTRVSSEYTKKKMALKRIKKHKDLETAIKMGKAVASRR